MREKGKEGRRGMDIEKMRRMSGEGDCQEYLKRWKDNFDGKELSEMGEEDIEVFRRVNESVVEVEKALGETYVYLLVSKYKEIELAAKSGLSNNQIRAYCGISTGKWKKLLEKYPLLKGRLEDWRDNLAGRAVMNVAKKIREEGDIKTSKWYLEKRDRERYGTGVDVTVNKNVKVEHSLNMEQMKALRDNLKRIKESSSGEVIEI